MTRVLPMRLVSSAWPSTLLILCEPVWLRSSRLRITRAPPQCSAKRGTSVMMLGPPGVGPVEALQLADEGRVDCCLAPHLLELLEGRDQGLRHVPTAEAAEPPTANGRRSHRWPSTVGRHGTP